MYRNGDAVDRRFLDFHYTMPRSFHFMDLDGVPFCAKCREPLALVETSRDPKKATTVIRNLARKAELRAYLVIVPDDPASFAGDTPVTIRRVWPWPEETHRTDLREWIEIERTIRHSHERSCPNG